MTSEEFAAVRDLLLTRQGLVFVPEAAGPAHSEPTDAVALELADLGYVISSRLHARLAQTSLAELTAIRAWVTAALVAHSGGDQQHVPLFRRFPEDIPSDTRALWWSKVLVHFLQAEGQPCLFCCQVGTTHVLQPCRHVVCDRCFDGSSYSACPVCEHHVDRTSPFFLPGPEGRLPAEQVRFRLLDLGDDMDEQARALFLRLCARTQALSPDDRQALSGLVRAYGSDVLAWLPPAIPVRENVAIIFGTLAQLLDPTEVVAPARRYLRTATDVLRLIAVMSGSDASLQRQTVYRGVQLVLHDGVWQPVTEALEELTSLPRVWDRIPKRVNRFKMARLSRPLRRALLHLLDGMDAGRLTEDMLRHRSHWVWAGEFLHPHEYAARYPNVARAFQIVRTQSPDGTPAPRFQGWHSRYEQAVRAGDAGAMLDILTERPGELARRFDHLLRVAGEDEAAIARALDALATHVSSFATPVLVTLRHALPTRAQRARVRMYWPKGQVGKGVSGPDDRAVLTHPVIARAVGIIEAELLRRFAELSPFEESLVDEALKTVVVPFNERTASSAAVSLPRGSRIPVPGGKVMRLFLHWCQPDRTGTTTDLDLSVALYDADWQYVGVCSFYELRHTGADGALIAQSAGDLRDAPWPDGASEFVDLHRDAALAAGVRYAVMVVNHYVGLPFNQQERGFAGLMLRDDPGGDHFDPRTVTLRFALDGGHGVYMPLVLDLGEGVLHWLDVHAKGELEMNSVETSKAAISTICPTMIAYFGSGVRPSMFDLALLHAATRCTSVILRGSTLRRFVRRADEPVAAFHERLARGESDAVLPSLLEAGEPQLALLYRGDVDLPDGSAAYALFRERVTPTLAASDLLS